jgi:hypothetical protein
MTRNHRGEAERSGAGRVEREFVPVAKLGKLRGARHQQERHLIGRRRVGDAGDDGDVPVIEFLGAEDAWHAGAVQAGAWGVVLRRGGVELRAEVPYRGVGVERRAIVEQDAVPQGDDPPLGIRRIAMPVGGQSWHQA